jgi:hypothetical protein
VQLCGWVAHLQPCPPSTACSCTGHHLGPPGDSPAAPVLHARSLALCRLGGWWGFRQWGGSVAPYATCGHDVWAYRDALQCLPCPALTFSADCRPPSCPQCESWGWTGRSADCRRDWARAGTGLLPCGPLCPCASWSPPDTCHPALGVRCVLRVRGGGCGTCGGRLCCGFGAHSSA